MISSVIVASITWGNEIRPAHTYSIVAQEALTALVTVDKNEAVRQVAMVDAKIMAAWCPDHDQNEVQHS